MDPITIPATVLNKKQVRVCSWNIRRGLILREQEIINLIKQNSINILFLVETDTNEVNVDTDYTIQGFKTIIQNKKDSQTPTRIICLVDEKLSNETTIRMDLTDENFPSLWIELDNNTGANTICGGFYREWAPLGGIRNIDAQIEAIEIFTDQIERAAAEKKQLIILGDANLCSERWNAANYTHKRIAGEIQETLIQCGLTQVPLGPTYLADRLDENGMEIQSAIDHAYVSQSMMSRTNIQKLDNSATDHLPILASFILKNQTQILKTKSSGSIYKRSMKDFNKTRWIDCLRSRNWNNVSTLTHTNEKTEEFTKEINAALDECAPMKRFKTRENFRPGLSEETKKIMAQRDQTRKSIKEAKISEKPGLKARYRNLRNRAVFQMRADTLKRNAERISEAKNEGETWKVINEIIKPKSTVTITISTPEGELTDEREIATAFNEYFVDKISKLKENIDHSIVENPLRRIEEKLKNKNLQFSLKQVSVKTVTKVMKAMSKKKSKGNDGISQECLLLGTEVLAGPLTKIINTSIETGHFPDQWKEAIVVPILKKGNPKELKNYRPVSCLPAASKVLEKVVCDQLTRYVEVQRLLPDNQHGFRAHRSTMTALSSMQKDWIQNTEDGLMTGILVWDLSAAFDTLDIDLFLLKLKLYGADHITLRWFRSFLTDRTQRVRIGSTTSDSLKLVSGVPQGGILSPIVFTLYTADMELWLRRSRLSNFADDTTTDISAKTKEEIINHLTTDAMNVLSFMATNGLVANQTKTEFLLLNEKNKTEEPVTEILVGQSLVQRTYSTKLLGVMIDENQDWLTQLKGVTSSLNQRLYIIRRIQNHLPQEKLLCVVHSLWMSRLRYGLQLYAKVALNEDDRKSQILRSLQHTQNRMLRGINGSRVKDKISVKSLLEKYGLLSVNQVAAQIKLIEVWKSINVQGHPLKMNPYSEHNSDLRQALRERPNRVYNDTAKFVVSQNSFHVDAAKIWNRAPKAVTAAKTINELKKATMTFVKTLPI